MGERMKSVQHGELPPPTEDGVAGTQVDLADDFFLPGGEHSPRLTSSSTTDFDTAFDGHHGQLQRHEKEDADDGSNSDSPSGSSSTGDTAPSPASREFMVTEDGQAYRWPHPPPPPIASSPGQQSRISFHGARYGKFVAAYTGMERANVDEAVRRCRTISMIGLVWRREATLGIVTSRAFLRHSVLAVEGDALFIAMISQAETLTASAEMNLRKDFPYIDERLSTNVGASPTENGRGLSGGPRAQKRRAATSMQPNARCIALHYGLPGSTAYPQATLIVVVSTTRMEASTPIFISLESYYRCLDEQAWYRRFYGHHVPQTSPATAEAELDDILHGIKSFPRWPDQLSYYHGVGQRHVGTVAEAAFPFTLLDLSLTPELGENELGLNAAAPIPYATCLLYTGPSVSTAHVEKWLRSGGESTRNHATNAGKAPQPEEAEEDLHFAMDDTYALGLGKHGVCFGQGLSRYINHRYNLRRFGNVELCSVMITVPSDFVIPQGALPSHDRGKDRKKLCTSPTLPQKDRGSQRLADKKSQQRRKATSGKTRVPNKKSGHSAFKDRAIFHEEDSLCLTLPFFIATTDIEAGEPLLAWTYGDEYDAKLERSAVAGGFLIPYADGVLLNGSRLMMGSAGMPPTAPLKGLEHLFTWPPGKRWQRYGGDYRFSITVGDIVWRRRPFPSSNKNPATLIPSEVPISDDDSGCPFPEEDLFVVMDVIPNCTEWILLRPLERLQLSQKQLRTLFTEQGLSHHQFSSSATGPDRRSKGANRWEGWAVFDALLDLGNNNGTKSYDSGHSRQMDASLLHRCWVASTDSLALLLVDMDYTIGRDETPTGKAVRSPTSRKELLNYQIIISLEHLRSVTRPVRCGPRAMGPLTPLFNGILWPFFRTHYAAGYSPSTPG